MKLDFGHAEMCFKVFSIMTNRFGILNVRLLEVFLSVFNLSQNEIEVASELFDLVSKIIRFRFVRFDLKTKYIQCSLAEFPAKMEISSKEQMIGKIL